MKCSGGLGSPGKEVEGATPTHEELAEGVTIKLPVQEASGGDVAERRINPLSGLRQISEQVLPQRHWKLIPK